MVILSAFSGFAQRVAVEYDHSRNFSVYRTYSWMKQLRAEPSDVQFPSQNIRDRIIASIDEALAAKHLTKVEQAGDLLADYEMEISATPRPTTYRDEFSPTLGWPGQSSGVGWVGGIGSVSSQTMTQIVLTGTLVIGLTESRKRHLVFQGKSSDTFTSRVEKNVMRLEKGVRKIFIRYPSR
jgi:hypothetical protein